MFDFCLNFSYYSNISEHVRKSFTEFLINSAQEGYAVA